MLVVLFGLTFTLQAQEKRSIANLQIGIGGTVEGTSVKTPAVYGSYEYFLWDNLSVGGLIGYSTLNIKIENAFGDDIDNDTSNLVAGGLMNYYFYQNEKLEFYSHVALGYASGLTASLFYEFGAGGRYKLSDSLYLNSEIGIGLSLLKLGVTFQL
ncbi:hypothetical protein [Polaribacter vadi]|uniref:hypothetical protein n=1 Tax=Polaribacter vadi TaxID=1774273 RepID=UPI0030ECA1A4